VLSAAASGNASTSPRSPELVAYLTRPNRASNYNRAPAGGPVCSRLDRTVRGLASTLCSVSTSRLPHGEDRDRVGVAPGTGRRRRLNRGAGSASRARSARDGGTAVDCATPRHPKQATGRPRCVTSRRSHALKGVRGGNSSVGSNPTATASEQAKRKARPFAGRAFRYVRLSSVSLGRYEGPGRAVVAVVRLLLRGVPEGASELVGDALQHGVRRVLVPAAHRSPGYQPITLSTAVSEMSRIIRTVAGVVQRPSPAVGEDTGWLGRPIGAGQGCPESL
jgi:hypothetical protein